MIKFTQSIKITILILGTLFLEQILSTTISATQAPDYTIDCYYSNIQKVYLHLNKSVFITGEDVLFKAYLVDAKNIPDTSCKILYVELKNSNNKEVAGYSLNISKGSCNSFFTLPDTLTTGTYFIRAFTNQMRNFDHDYYFSTQIIVANQADNQLEKLVYRSFDQQDSVQKQTKNFQIQSEFSGINEIKICVSGSEEDSSKPLIFKAYCNGVCYYHKEIILSQCKDSIVIPVSNENQGFNILTVFSKTQELLCKTGIYIPDKSELIDIKCDKEIYSTREKVRIVLNVKDSELLKDNCSLSVNISKKSFPEYNLKHSNIDTYLNLESFFSQKNLKAIGNNVDSATALKKLLEQFDFPKLVSSRSLRFIPENNGYVLSGRILSKDYKPIPGVCVYVSAIDTVTNLKYCYSDTTGKFYFRLNRFYDNKNLVIQTASENSEPLLISIENKFDGEGKYAIKSEFIPYNLKNELKNLQNINLTNKVLKINLLTSNNEKLPDLTNFEYNFYGQPDQTIYPADYSDLADLKEIERNILPQLYYNKADNKIRIVDIGTKKLWQEEALLVLNNLPFPDPAFIAGMSSMQIKKIDLKSHIVNYGDINFYGILSITTYQKDLFVFNPDYSHITFRNAFDDNPVFITGPEYSQNTENIRSQPDLRQTLFWNPEFKLSIDGENVIEFYTSDLQGIYDVEIEGITSKGKVIFSKSKIEVQQNEK